MTRLEDVPLFIEGVDKDMISDLATRVVFEVLSDFTKQMMTSYPTLASSTSVVVHELWDASTADLRPKSLTLPTAFGKQLVLIPKSGWVEGRLIMNANAFYNRKATQVMQDETVTVGSDGKVMKQSKRSIKALSPDVKETNVRKAVEYAETQSRSLVDEYRGWSDANVPLITDAEVDTRLQ